VSFAAITLCVASQRVFIVVVVVVVYFVIDSVPKLLDILSYVISDNFKIESILAGFVTYMKKHLHA